MCELLEDCMGYYFVFDYQQILYGMMGKFSCLIMFDDELVLIFEVLRSEGYFYELYDFFNQFGCLGKFIYFCYV